MNLKFNNQIFQLLSAIIAIENFLIYLTIITKFSSDPLRDITLAQYAQILGTSGIIAGFINYLYPKFRKEQGLLILFWSQRMFPKIGILITTIGIILTGSTILLSFNEVMLLLVLGGITSGSLIFLAITIQEFQYKKEYFSGQFVQLAYTSLSLGLVYFINFGSIQIILISAFSSFSIACCCQIYIFKYLKYKNGKINTLNKDNLKNLMEKSMDVAPFIIIFSLASLIDPVLITHLHVQGYSNYIISNRICTAITNIFGTIYVLQMQNIILKYKSQSHYNALLKIMLKKYYSSLLTPAFLCGIIIVSAFILNINKFLKSEDFNDLLQQVYSILILSPTVILTVLYSMLVRMVITKSIQFNAWHHSILWAVVYIFTAIVCTHLYIQYIFEISSIAAWLILLIYSIRQLKYANRY